MRHFLYLILFGLFSIVDLKGQQDHRLLFVGDVRCSKEKGSSIGLPNVFVIPMFSPRKFGLSSDPTGYFQINTREDYNDYCDQTVVFKLVTKKGVYPKTITRFVSKGDLERRIDGSFYLKLGAKYLETKSCSELSFTPTEIERFIDSLSKFNNATSGTFFLKRRQDKKDVLVATPSIVNVLKIAADILLKVGPLQGNDSVIRVPRVEAPNLGTFSINAVMVTSGNRGFNFCPIRDHSEAVFWNPSAFPFGQDTFSIFSFTNLRDHWKISAFKKVSSRFFLGLGILRATQRDFKYMDFEGALFRQEYKLKANESLFTLSSVFKVNEKLSTSFSAKLIRQKFDYTSGINLRTLLFTHNKFSHSFFDADASLHYSLNMSSEIGISAMNLFNSRMYAVLPQGLKTGRKIKARMVGVGYAYRLRRLNIGVDVLFHDEGRLYSFGVNYIPTKHVLLNYGVGKGRINFSSWGQDTKYIHSASLAYKSFKISYINKNDVDLNRVNANLFIGYSTYFKRRLKDL